MRISRKHALCALLLIAAVLPRRARAIEEEELRGIKRFSVSVESLPQVATDLGMTKVGIRAMVSSRLQDAGIPVGDTDLDSHLCVNMWAFNVANSPNCIYSIRVELWQYAVLLRDSLVSALATSWDETHLGIVPSDQFSEVTKDVIGQSVDHFIIAYLKANR